jgi:NADH-quinone oxidoreductase subunit G
VQRFYPALQATSLAPFKVEVASTRRASVLTASQPELQGPQADFAIPAMLAARLGLEGLLYASLAAVFAQIGAAVPAFEGLNYQKLTELREQWPVIGRSDLWRDQLRKQPGFGRAAGGEERATGVDLAEDARIQAAQAGTDGIPDRTSV